MAPQEWEQECDRAVEALGKVCQAVIDDTFDIVRVKDAHGNELTGVKVGERVIFLLVPEDKQVPLRGAEETLQ